MNGDIKELEKHTGASGRRLALVVGTNQIATPVPAPLEFAIADAEEMAEVLERCCHFELFELPVLGAQATSDAIRKAALRLARDRAPEDVILFYFSGHGIQAHDVRDSDIRHTYLGTADFDSRDVEDDASMHISLHWLRDKLFQNSEAGQVIIILDCCYAEDVRTGSDHMLDDLRAKLAYYFEIPGAEVGKRHSGLRVALAAAAYDQTAREEEGHGRMTSLILEALHGEVLTLIDEKGAISLSRLAEYLVRQSSSDQKPAHFSSNATGQECVMALHPQLVPLLYPPQSGSDRPAPYIPFPGASLFQGHTEGIEYLSQILHNVEGPAAPGATFSLSWESMRTEEAYRLLLLASCFAEATSTPLWLLELAAGLGEQDTILELLGMVPQHSQDLSLPEELSSQEVRLHPLVRESARGILRKAGKQGADLLQQARQRLADVCTLNWLEQKAQDEGYWGLLKRIRMMRAYSDALVVDEKVPMPTFVHALERWLDRESYLLAKEIWWPTRLPWLLYQQLFNRAVETDALLSPRLAGTQPIRWVRQLRSARTDDHTLLRLFAGHASAVTGVAFSPDGKLVLTGSSDGTARIWERESARELCPLRMQGQTISITSAAFSPDGKEVLIGCGDRTARIWDWEGQCELACLQGHTNRVRCVAFSSDGTQILTGSSDGTARLWNRANACELACLQGHTDWVTSVAFSPDGAQLLTGSGDRTARLWDRASKQELARLQGHNDLVTSVAFSPDGNQILTGSNDQTARLWDCKSGCEQSCLQGHTSGVWSVAFSPDGKLLMTGSEDGTTRLWDREMGRELACLQGHTSIVRCVAFSPDGKLVLTGSGDGTARLWDWKHPRDTSDAQAYANSITSVAFSPDGTQLLTGSRDRIARLWDRESRRELASLQGHTGWVMSVAFAPGGKQFLTGSADGTARLWDCTITHELGRLQGHTDWVRGVAFSPDGLHFLTCSSDGTARLWDSYTNTEFACLQGHTDWVTSIAFSSDGKQILTGSNDKTARLWDRNTAREIAILQGHTDWITSVAFSPDGKLALTGGDDGTARLWDNSTASELACLQGHTSGVRSLAFSPDGHIALTCDANGWVFFWQVSQPGCGDLIGLYVAHYEVGAIYWESARDVLLADTGGPGGRPHIYDLSLEGMNEAKEDARS